MAENHVQETKKRAARKHGSPSFFLLFLAEGHPAVGIRLPATRFAIESWKPV